MVEAVVEYDYTAQEPDELTIRKGDVIREIIKKQGGWWEGTLRDKRGMFPDNFVTVILKEKVSQRQKPGRSLRQCKAVFSYHPAHDDELSLSVGDVIEVLGEVEEGWWRGKIGDSEGVFPSNFVVEIDHNKSHSKNNSKEDLTSVLHENDVNTPNLPPKPSKIICQVKYAYDACNDDELTLREGDLINLLSKEGQDKGWWRGELNGRVGVFPDNFVTVVPSGEVNGPGGDTPDLDRKLSPARGGHRVNVAAHRNSLDLKTSTTSPPIPGKKPAIPKKSPSAAPVSGVMAGLKQKLSDLVDGAAISRSKHPEHTDKDKDKDKPKEVMSKDREIVKDKDGSTVSKEMDLDQVERSSMLMDMRAGRAKAPGRRPPSTVYRDTEMVNGNAEHVKEIEKIESEEEEEKKPKVREWEKNKAPWVAELKQNQAKRTSTGPITPPVKTDKPDKLEKTPEPQEEAKWVPEGSGDISPSPVDMSRSMSALSRKTPDSDFVVHRTKPTQPITVTPARPQSIHAGSSPLENKISPVINIQKPPIADKTNIEAKTASPRTSIEKKNDFISMKQYFELADRVTQIENKFQQKLNELQERIDELEGKLKVESDLRRHFQVELEKVAQCVTQV